MDIRPYEGFDEAELLSLYESVGWTNYTARPDMLREAFAHSLLTLGAYEDGKLMGVVRAVGDGYSVVLVQDLLLFPEYQHRGVGTALLRAVLDRFPDVYQLQLLTDDTPEHAAFYTSLGFVNVAKYGCAAYQRA